MNKILLIKLTVALGFSIMSFWLKAQPCNVTPFPAQMELDSDFQFTNSENNPVRIKELSLGYPNAIGLDTDSDHSTGVASSLLFGSGSTGFVVVPNSIPLGTYQIERKEFPSGCLDTVEIEVVTTLPVEWLKPLTCQKKEDQVEISFATAQQLNNSHFEIEQSKNGREFYKIGEIEGEGTTTSENYYSFTDEKPSYGVNYYRIKQVDYDGRYDYSNVASINIESEDAIIFPNPARNEITIQSASQQEVIIYNQLGEIIRKNVVDKVENKIDISEFSKGTYYLKLASKTELIIKE